MTVHVQNLRSFTTGAEPTSLLPGQICFNLADKVVYVGNGSNFRISFDGTQSPGVTGEGWYAMPMDFDSLSDFFVKNPQYYGDVPTDNQVLTWSTSLNHPIWTSGGGGGGQVYTVTNNQVALAPGTTTSEKISNAIGVASPDEGDTTIVTGQPGEVYQGLYIFTTEWVRAASYANLTANQVQYDPSTSGLPAITVQSAVDELNTDVVAATATANTAFSTANSAAATAAAALPKAGGTMTGSITFAGGQVFPVSGIQDATTAQKGVVQVGSNIQVSGGTISVLDGNTSNKGVVQLTSSLTTTSSSLGLTATAGKDLQDQINSLSLASNVTLAGSLDTTTGDLDSVTTQGSGAGFVAGNALPAPAPGNADYYVIVTVGGPYNPPGGGGPYNAEGGDWFLSNGTVWQYLGVGARPQSATYTAAGIVQLADTPTTYTGTSNTEAVTPNSLQAKLSDSTSLADSNRIASSTAVKTAYDLAAAAIPCSIIVNKGAIITGTGAGAPVALPVGTNGQVLIANSACSSGLEWVSDTPGDVTSVSGTAPITVNNTNPQTPIVGVSAASTAAAGVVQLNDTVTSTSTSQAATANVVKAAFDLASTACGIAVAAVPCASFLASGNLLAGTGAGTYAALTVGTNGQVLIANSACTEGVEWGNACYVPDACFTAVGDIIVGTGAASYTALPVGTDGQTLVADSACVSGVKWGVALAGFTQGSTTFNTALGVGTGCCLTTGTLNVLLGAGAGDCLTTGSCNIAIGYNALGGSLAGSINETIAIGYEAGGCLYGGSQNIIVGTCAGFKITSGFCNVVIGDCTACGLTGGAQNTIIGAGAATSALAFTSNANTGVGYRAFHKITSGAFNSTLGTDSGCAITTGSCNVTLGSASGYTLTTGCLNTFLGYLSGCGITTGGCNTIVGRYSTVTSGLSNNVILADGAGSVRFQANSSGAWSYDGTNFGTAGQFLASQGSGTTPVWCTLSLACIPCSAFTAIGDLLVGTGAGTYAALSVGTNGQVLLADSTCTGGVKWGTALQGYTCGSTLFNTALGCQAGDSITSGTFNTVIGYDAGTALTSGGSNTFVGYQAGDGNNGVNNTVVGRGAMSTSGGNGNTIMGFCAGAALNVANSNTLIGANAGDAIVGGNSITGVGQGVLGGAATGVGTVAVGAGSLASLTSGTGNIAVGYLALDAVTTGGNNTAVGYQAGTNVATNVSGNTLFGSQAGQGVTSGGQNTLIGNGAGSSITTGANNTIVGRYNGTSTLGSNVVLANGGGDIRFQSNATGAWSPDGVNYGNAGDTLQSSGTGAPPTWVTGASGTFTSQDGKTITVTNGLITSIV